VSSEKAKLEKCITEYNDLSANCEGFSAASADAVISGNFPWSILTGLAVNCGMYHVIVYSRIIVLFHIII